MDIPGHVAQLAGSLIAEESDHELFLLRHSHTSSDSRRTGVSESVHI